MPVAIGALACICIGFLFIAGITKPTTREVLSALRKGNFKITHLPDKSHGYGNWDLHVCLENREIEVLYARTLYDSPNEYNEVFRIKLRGYHNYEMYISFVDVTLTNVTINGVFQNENRPPRETEAMHEIRHIIDALFP